MGDTLRTKTIYYLHCKHLFKSIIGYEMWFIVVVIVQRNWTEWTLFVLMTTRKIWLNKYNIKIHSNLGANIKCKLLPHPFSCRHRILIVHWWKKPGTDHFIFVFCVRIISNFCGWFEIKAVSIIKLMKSIVFFFPQNYMVDNLKRIVFITFPLEKFGQSSSSLMLTFDKMFQG